MDRQRLGLAAAVLCGAALRTAGRLFSHYVDVDGSSFIAMTQALVDGGGIGVAELRYWPPLFPGLAALVSTVVGASAELGVAAVAVLSGALLALPLAVLGQHLGGPRAGLLAAWASALLPPLVMVAHRDLSESLGMLCLASAAALAVWRPARGRSAGRALARGAAAGAFLALAFLTRFELLLGLPALAWLLWRRPFRGLALAGLALGFVLFHLPYQALLLDLGEGWLLPDTRLSSNVAETMSGGALSFGFDAPGSLGMPDGHSVEMKDPVAKRWQELLHSLSQLPRALPPTLLGFALLGLGRREARPVLLLGLPCLASFAVVDHETRYWLTLTVAAIPVAAAAFIAWRPRLEPALVALVPLGLMAWPRSLFPDGPLPVLGPGEDLLSTLLDPTTTLSAAEGPLLFVLRPLLVLVGLAVVGLALRARSASSRSRRAYRAASGARSSASLVALSVAATLTALLVHHFEHARASLPPVEP